MATTFWRGASNGKPDIFRWRILLTSGPAIGTSYAYETQYLGNNEWGVYVDFTQIGTSPSNPGSYSAFVGSNDPGLEGTTGTFGAGNSASPTFAI
ncbi:MAG: hypothetical protein C7B43_07945 [Sulfobacillus benefaciens]|uniref:Uncharacterized protein n=1 Tax=Sulfobacillus benefaciens TaxID=453960 RepID=A0A2T2X4Z0_9FIRM|nr:MAG: hypothetical protein C7B43_07945 [Sulfobacillus benefaciens]HBQ96030.1 hypothetical protein [Sulfobacillus sp.]